MKQIVNTAGYPLSLEDVQSYVGPGWSKLIEKLVEDLFSMGWNGELVQVKEKFGSLCWYIDGGGPKVIQRIDRAELDSTTICEKCGAPGKNSDWGKYWFKTLCQEHGEERQLD